MVVVLLSEFGILSRVSTLGQHNANDIITIALVFCIYSLATSATSLVWLCSLGSEVMGEGRQGGMGRMYGLHSPYTEKVSISPFVKAKLLGPAWQLNTEMEVFAISVAANVRVVLLLALFISVSTDKIIPSNRRMESS